MKLIDDIGNYFKFNSVRLGLIGILTSFPDVWNVFPAEFKALIPAQYLPHVGVFFFVCSLIARGVKQNGLESQNQN